MGGVSGRLEPAAVRRTVGEVATLMADRERRFASIGVDSMATYRKRRAAAAGGAADDPFGDVFLVVDGWATLRTEYDDLEPVITDLATRGLSYGVHVVASAARWMDFRPAIRDLFGSKLELRLGDPSDSAVSRKAAVNVPDRAPRPRHHRRSSCTSWPRCRAIGRRRDRPTWSSGGGRLDRGRPRRGYGCCRRGAVLGHRRRHATSTSRSRCRSASPRPTCGPVLVDFDSEPHFLLFGDAECGKSTFLRTLATTIADRFTPGRRPGSILVDYRRSLLGSIDRRAPHRLRQRRRARRRS